MNVSGWALLRLHGGALFDSLSFIPVSSLFLLLHVQMLKFTRSLSITLRADAG
jgi:hypothetical protein